ncbi:MAG: DUF2975 domain-containing protein [Kordiimonadaceae bacterium]|nr:DUF2975 domain-containing protein [Kordiimonadaceae bacterium]
MSYVMKLSKTMARLCVIVSIALPVTVIMVWFSNFWEPQSQIATMLHLSEINMIQRFLGITASSLFPAVLVFGLLNLRWTFLEASHARYFSEKAVSSFRTFAWSVFFAIPTRIIEGAMVSVITSWHLGEGNRQLSIGIGTPELASLFLAFLFVAIAHIWAEGQKYAEDSEQII